MCILEGILENLLFSYHMTILRCGECSLHVNQYCLQWYEYYSPRSNTLNFSFIYESLQQFFVGYNFSDVYRQGFPRCVNKLLKIKAVENLKLNGSTLAPYPQKHTTLLIFIQIVKKNVYPFPIYIFVWKINNVTLLQEKLTICQVHLNMYDVHAHVKTFYFALVFMWNLQSIQW